MNPEALTLVSTHFDTIAATVDMRLLVDQMHLAKFLTQQQANTIKSHVDPVQMLRALLSIVEKQPAGFHNLCFSLQKCRCFTILESLNPICPGVISDLFSQQTPRDNSRQTFDYSISREFSLEARVILHPITGADTPVAKFDQSGYPQFYLTSAQLSVLQSQHHNVTTTSDMGCVRVCCLGAEAPVSVYDGIEVPFDPHNRTHLDALNDDHANTINRHLHISPDSPAANRSIIYDGIHVLVSNTEHGSSVLFQYADGCTTTRLLDISFDDYERLHSTLGTLLRILPALPDLPLPKFVPSFISEPMLKLSTDAYFNAVAKYTRQMLRASEAWECGGCAIDGLEHTCRRSFCALLNEQLSNFTSNHLSLPSTQAKVHLIMCKIGDLLLNPIAVGYVYDVLSAKFQNEEIPAGDLLKNALIYHGVRNIVPPNKVFELEHFVELVINHSGN